VSGCGVSSVQGQPVLSGVGGGSWERVGMGEKMKDEG